MQEFCEKKGKDIPELSDEDWMADFAFADDCTDEWSEHKTLRSFVRDMVKTFMRK